MAKDYYDILEISKSASDDDIKKAYRKLAMKYHPDKNKGDKKSEEKFKEITKAYEVLKDPQKRSNYDRFGDAGAQGGGGFGGFESSGSPFDMFSDLFGKGGGGGFADMFGGSSRSRSGAGQPRGEDGSDLQDSITITLEEAFEGVKKEITYYTEAKCKDCKGSGAKGGKASYTTCNVCNGSGAARIQQGFFMVEQTCSNCHGSGQVIKDRCGTCHGAGKVETKKTLEVTIPKGIRNGDRMRLAGQGCTGVKGGRDGDMYLTVLIKNHAFFTRDEADLSCSAEVDIFTLTLGGEITVHTIEGKKISTKISAGTQTNAILKASGKGMSQMNSSKRGDMYIKITPKIPTNLTEEQKTALKGIKEIF